MNPFNHVVNLIFFEILNSYIKIFIVNKEHIIAYWVTKKYVFVRIGLVVSFNPPKKSLLYY